MGGSPKCNIPSFMENSQQEDFWRVFTIYGRGGHLGHVTQMTRTNFRSPTQGGSIQNLPLIGQVFLRRCLKLWMDRQTPNQRTKGYGAWVYYNLTYELKDGELTKSLSIENYFHKLQDSNKSLWLHRLVCILSVPPGILLWWGWFMALVLFAFCKCLCTHVSFHIRP